MQVQSSDLTTTLIRIPESPIYVLRGNIPNKEEGPIDVKILWTLTRIRKNLENDLIVTLVRRQKPVKLTDERIAELGDRRLPHYLVQLWEMADVSPANNLLRDYTIIPTKEAENIILTANLPAAMDKTNFSDSCRVDSERLEGESTTETFQRIFREEILGRFYGINEHLKI
ncbi:MAG: hypothetical protein ACD_28C00363G0001 [uncultured bacterium]|nr:MAG: hypothetical protein ACD_28C00363G0001 [uncultured bacterium]